VINKRRWRFALEQLAEELSRAGAASRTGVRDQRDGRRHAPVGVA